MVGAPRTLRTVGRAAGLLAVCAAAAAGTWSLAAPPLSGGLALLRSDHAAPVEVSFEEGLTALCAAVLSTCVLWLLVGVLLAVASQVAEELVPRSTTAAVLAEATRRGCPRSLRRVVVMALGVAVGAGAATPALATAKPPGPGAPVAARSGPHGQAADGLLAGLAVPDRMTGGAGTAARRTVEPRRVRTVVVRGGDSLWSIAADLLSSRATGPTTDRVTDRDITVAWHRLHAANADRVGPDPDLIVPGTRLVVPAPSEQLPSDREEHP